MGYKSIPVIFGMLRDSIGQGCDAVLALNLPVANLLSFEPMVGAGSCIGACRLLWVSGWTMCLQVRGLSTCSFGLRVRLTRFPRCFPTPQLATVGLMLVPLLICPINNVKLTAREGYCAVAALRRAACLWYQREVGTLHCLLQ